MSNFREYAAACPHRIDVPLERRPGNALNIEIGKPLDRCRLRPPEHWPEGIGGRWLASGGSPLVFEPCSARECPNDPRQARLRRLRAAVEVSIGEGFILHIEAEPIVDKRTERIIAAGFSGTIGPVVGAGFGAFSYGRWPIEERFRTAGEAARWIARHLGAERAGALRAALNKAHADESAEHEEQREHERSRRDEEARLIRAGRRLRGAYGHRADIVGPIFGPSGTMSPLDDSRLTLASILETAERAAYRDALTRLGGSITEAARALAVDRKTASRAVERLGLRAWLDETYPHRDPATVGRRGDRRRKSTE